MLRRPTTFAVLAAAALMATLMIGASAQAGSKPPTITIATHQNEIAPGIKNQGWWDATGAHIIGNENYIVGQDGETNSPFRNFFSFDTSLAGGKCASAATLLVPIETGGGDFGLLKTIANYVLHDVSTDVTTLNTTAGPDLSITHDLGTGALYGSRALPTFGPYGGLTSFPIDLNVAGVAALNAAIRAPHPGYFSLGGVIQGEPTGVSLFLFSGSHAARLMITVGSC